MCAEYPLYTDNTLCMTVKVERLQMRHLTLLAGWSDNSHTRKHINDKGIHTILLVSLPSIVCYHIRIQHHK